MMATHCLNLAKDQSAELPHELRLALARQLVLVGQPIVAVDLLVDNALNGTDAGPGRSRLHPDGAAGLPRPARDGTVPPRARP